MREINILGLSLHDYTLREKMRMLDGFLDHGVPGTVEFVSAKEKTGQPQAGDVDDNVLGFLLALQNDGGDE